MTLVALDLGRFVGVAVTPAHAPPWQPGEIVCECLDVNPLGLEPDANASVSLDLIYDAALRLIERRSSAVAVFKDGAIRLRAAGAGEAPAMVAMTRDALVQLDPAFEAASVEELGAALRACSPHATKGRVPGPPGALARVAFRCRALDDADDPFESQADAARRLSDASRLWRTRIERNAKRRKGV